MPLQPSERVDNIKEYFNNEGLRFYGQLVKSEFPKFEDYNRLYNLMARRPLHPTKEEDLAVIEMLESIINKREKSKR